MRRPPLPTLLELEAALIAVLSLSALVAGAIGAARQLGLVG